MEQRTRKNIAKANSALQVGTIAAWLILVAIGVWAAVHWKESYELWAGSTLQKRMYAGAAVLLLMGAGLANGRLRTGVAVATLGLAIGLIATQM